MSLTGEAKAAEALSTPRQTGEEAVGLHLQRNSAGAYRSNWNPLDLSRKEAEEGVCWGSSR